MIVLFYLIDLLLFDCWMVAFSWLLHKKQSFLITPQWVIGFTGSCPPFNYSNNNLFSLFSNSQTHFPLVWGLNGSASLLFISLLNAQGNCNGNWWNQLEWNVTAGAAALALITHNFSISAGATNQTFHQTSWLHLLIWFGWNRR